MSALKSDTQFRVGLLGGAFDPIHHGHLRIAQEALEQLKLDRVIFIPTARPPHKSDATLAFEQRCELVQLAIADHPYFVMDDREGQRQGHSYSLNTLQAFTEEQPNTEFFWLIGSDAWQGITGWHKWQQCLELATFVVFNRPDALTSRLNKPRKLPTTAPKNAKLVSLTINPLDISSTQIRDLLNNGRSPRYLLPDSVAERLQKSA